MVKMSVLNDALKSICNAEKAGKRQVKPSLFASRGFFLPLHVNPPFPSVSKRAKVKLDAPFFFLV